MPTEVPWASALRDSPIFLVLVGCSVVTLAVACERIHYFWKRRADADGLLRQVCAAFRLGQIERAETQCHTSPHPFGDVAARLLEAPDADANSSEERIQIALSEQKLLFEKNLGLLGTMAAVAPLIGLLGTVVGIMRAFGDMARIGSASPSVVAAGVAEALITTAAGLIVAVPAVMLFNHLNRRMNACLTVTENHARALRVTMREASDDTSSGPGSGAGRPDRAAPAAAPARTATPVG
jgi:biopolymer transport protein ExbB